jgi:hypothetical protein
MPQACQQGCKICILYVFPLWHTPVDVPLLAQAIEAGSEHTKGLRALEFILSQIHTIMFAWEYRLLDKEDKENTRTKIFAASHARVIPPDSNPVERTLLIEQHQKKEYKKFKGLFVKTTNKHNHLLRAYCVVRKHYCSLASSGADSWLALTNGAG